MLCLYSSVQFFSFSLISLGVVVFGEGQEKWVGLLLFCIFLGFACFILWYLNRAACIVWVENDVVKCRGLICGFYKKCSVQSIQAVKIQYVQREVGFGSFIYLIDDRTRPYNKFLRIGKDSYIAFRNNKKNLAFLRTFWSGRVEK